MQVEWQQNFHFRETVVKIQTYMYIYIYVYIYIYIYIYMHLFIVDTKKYLQSDWVRGVQY